MSGRKSVITPYVDPIINALSMDADQAGTPMNLQFLDNFGIQLKWTGSNPIGAITFQVSLDYNPNDPSAATWTTLRQPDGTILTVSPGGSAGNAYVDLNQLSAVWVRTVYTTADESDGALTVTSTAKMI